MARPRTSPVDEVPQSEWAIHERLVGWSEWCRVRHHQGHAMSAEGRQVKLGGALGRGPSLPSGSDATNAALLHISPEHRRALQLRYFERLPDRIICRILRLRASSYARFLSDARRLLDAALEP